MPGPPPPPPPPPPPGPAPFMGGPPPPPPLPGGSAFPAAPPKAVAKDRGALLADISKPKQLKKAVTNDRSAPLVDKKPDSGGTAMGGAPPVPGMKAPSGLAPLVPGGGNRARSNSDTGRSAGDSAIGSAPQLGGLFAAGMPKLKRTSGGVATGADDTHSDSETSRPAAPRRPATQAPPVPGAPSGAAPPIPRASGLRPSPQTMESAPVVPSPLAGLKKVPPRPVSKPSSIANLAAGKPPAPPPPPPTARKVSSSGTFSVPGPPPPPPPPLPSLVSAAPSSAAPPPPPSLPPASRSPAPPSAPPPPPTSSSPAPPAPPPPPPPPLPPSLAPSAPPSAPPLPPSAPSRAPPSRATPPPPPPPPSTAATMNGGHSPAASMAMKAAVSAMGRPSSNSVSSDAPPSPQAETSPPSIRMNSSLSQAPTRASMNASSYTLTNGNSSLSLGRSGGAQPIQDSRWKFQDESQLPPPRQYTGVPKRYRAGRGSSVPLDVSNLG